MTMNPRPIATLLAGVLLTAGFTTQASDTYGPVPRGANLWNIATRLYPGQGVTRNQVMLALLKANPQAFGAACNANSPLKPGVVLRVPPLAEVKALSHNEAQREFARQVQEWDQHLRTRKPLVCPPVTKPAAEAAESAVPAQRQPKPPLIAPIAAAAQTQPRNEAPVPATESQAMPPVQSQGEVPAPVAAKPAETPQQQAQAQTAAETLAPTSTPQAAVPPVEPQPQAPAPTRPETVPQLPTTTAAPARTPQAAAHPVQPQAEAPVSPATEPLAVRPQEAEPPASPAPRAISQAAAPTPSEQPRTERAASSVHQPRAPLQAQPARHPQTEEAQFPKPEWQRVWGQIEPEFARHEPIDWLSIPIVLALAAAIFLWKFRRKPAKPAGVPTPAPAEGAEDFAKLSVADAVERLMTDTARGLTAGEAQRRLRDLGPNALAEKRVTLLERVLPFFWGPIPWMIEVAAILSLLTRDWKDFAVILALLLFNALIGFWEESSAASALSALKSQLAVRARVLRDGRWQEIAAADLVPGDVVRIRLGDIVPADAKLVDGDYLSVDQSALTGESLPANKQAGEMAFSGSIAKQGEMVAVVTGTGANTFFGRTAKLVESAGAKSHLQESVLQIGNFLIVSALILIVILASVKIVQGASPLHVLKLALVLLVASIPVAMPAVLSVTMALGALALSKLKAIVSRMEAIEEMAGVDILCSDKTGTLTVNRLTLGQAKAFGVPVQDLLLAGALASKAENNDPIDLAVIAGLKDPGVVKPYDQLKFSPFDPVSKRTEASIRGPNGETFQVTKGAPQVILELAQVTDDKRERAERLVDDAATMGYRTLGVARTDGDGTWQFLGILPLFDPPREDSAATIAEAKRYGLAVKMVTGDNVAIAKQISGQLDIGTNILAADTLFAGGVSHGELPSASVALIEEANGFAQVFPEHKYGIVKALQQRNHIVAMTGDGVNDAPALKQADVGIAVSGATDAARGAAALVLTAPGLSVITAAVEESRRIFERMMSYIIYRIAMSIDIMLFVVLASLVFSFFPLTAIMLVVLALLDDVPIMAIAYDNTEPDPKPVRWNRERSFTVSIVLGLFSVLQSFGLLAIGTWYLHLDAAHLQTGLFLQLLVGGHLLLLLTRTKKPFVVRPFPSWQLLAAVLATQAFAVLMTGFGWLMPALPWKLIGWVWVYNLVWMVVLDLIKLGVYRVLDGRSRRDSVFSPHAGSFLEHSNRPIRGT
jgi:H+-transporting ATPase